MVGGIGVVAERREGRAQAALCQQDAEQVHAGERRRVTPDLAEVHERDAVGQRDAADRAMGGDGDAVECCVARGLERSSVTLIKAASRDPWRNRRASSDGAVNNTWSSRPRVSGTAFSESTEPMRGLEGPGSLRTPRGESEAAELIFESVRPA